MQFTRLKLKFDPGKFEKTDMEGVWSSLSALSVASEDMARISEVGLNLTEATEVVKLRTIFSGLGRVELMRVERLKKKFKIKLLLVFLSPSK